MAEEQLEGIVQPEEGFEDETGEGVSAQEAPEAEGEVEVVPEEWGEDISPEKDGGVYKKILVEGKGKDTPLDGDEVFVHYVGRLLNGEVFDSSRERGELFKFKLGAGRVISGWDIGVATMTMNEKCLLTCKSEYAYGEEGSPPKIPPNATLQFEVELFRWEGEDITNDGGVIKSVITKGDGFTSPTDGATCRVHLRGSYNGRVFEEGDITFDYGEGSESGLNPAIEKTIGTMKAKESARVFLKPQYAYGEKGSPDVGVPPNAEVTYEIRLNSFDKLKQSWEYDTVEERRTDAEGAKERGTKYFKEGKFPLAQKLYERAAELVGGNSIPKKEDKEALKGLRLALHLNLAACHLKMSEPSLAIKECEEVLAEDGKSIKAYFRRGQARQLLQDYEESIKDFHDVLQIEPTNKAAQTQIAHSRNRLKAIRDLEKKRYAHMFAHLSDEVDTTQEVKDEKAPPTPSPEAEEPADDGSTPSEPQEPTDEGSPPSLEPEPQEPTDEGSLGSPAEEQAPDP